MKENISIYEQCELAFENILSKCKREKNSELIGKSEDGSCVFYKLENGLYVWHLSGSIFSKNFKWMYLDIITNCDPTNIENVQDVYPAILKSTNDEIFYNDYNRKSSVRFEIFQNEDFSSYAEIRSEKDDKITEKSCLPVQPNTREDLSECFSSDVQQLLLQAKEKSSDETLINVYDKAIQLYDMFVEFSKDIELDYEKKENPDEQDFDILEWAKLQFDKSSNNNQEWLDNIIDEENPVEPENINVIKDLSVVYKIIKNQRDLGYQIANHHYKIIQEKKAEEQKIAEEEQREKREIYEKQRRKNYLGLINKAEKLGKGEMSLEDYVKSSKTSIEELIEFAKKEKMSADVIRGLHKYKKPYAVYKKPFSKKQYLEGTILLIDGQEVRPTETDVDKCVEFLKANDSLICDKTVKDTVRKYLRGEIDVTIKDKELQEQSEENKTNITENEYAIKQNLVEVIVGQQKKIKAQETEIVDLKSQDKGEV